MQDSSVVDPELFIRSGTGLQPKQKSSKKIGNWKILISKIYFF
jgi:hypothetical protein